MVVNCLLFWVAKQTSTDIFGLRTSYSYEISIGVMSSFLFFAYDIFLHYLAKASGECDVIANPGLGLLLLNLVIYGILSGYILFLAITEVLVPLPKCYSYWYNVLILGYSRSAIPSSFRQIVRDTVTAPLKLAVAFYSQVDSI